jgi:ribose transport system permease protein
MFNVDLQKIKKNLKTIPPVIWMLLSIVIIFSITGKNFLSYRNLINLLKQASPFLILAVGQTMAILVGGIDLSIGFVMSFSSVIVALSIQAGVPVLIAVFFGIATGGLCGFVNGVVVAKWKVPYFIATYGMGSIVLGLGSLLTGGVSVPALDRGFRFISDGKISQ